MSTQIILYGTQSIEQMLLNDPIDILNASDKDWKLLKSYKDSEMQTLQVETLKEAAKSEEFQLFFALLVLEAEGR